jgi:hypothetical protein
MSSETSLTNSNTNTNTTKRINSINEDEISKQLVSEGIKLKDQGKFTEAFNLFE